jgi:hypothetical protein
MIDDCIDGPRESKYVIYPLYVFRPKVDLGQFRIQRDIKDYLNKKSPTTSCLTQISDF